MNTKKICLIAGMLASVIATSPLHAFTYYMGGALGPITSSDGGPALAGTITLTNALGTAGGSSVWDISGAPVDPVTGEPTVTLSPGNSYILQNIVAVVGGTLKLLDGTIVRGQPAAGGATFDSGALVITRSARIRALGNAVNPVIFTSAAQTSAKNGNRATLATPTFFDSDPKNAPKQLVEAAIGQTAKWGGLIILGSAPTNIDRNLTAAVNSALVADGAVGDGSRVSFFDENPGSNPITTDDRSSVEGVPITSVVFTSGWDRYGGNASLDNSGVLNYVSIRYGGSNLAANNEINGLTLGGVGAGTLIDFLEIFGNSDDGIEVFGGSVNVKHAVVLGVEDDMFDFDAGYTGYFQYLLGIGWGLTGSASTGADYTDRAFEWDGSYRLERPEGFRGPASATLAETTAINAGGLGAVTSNQSNVGNVVLNATIIGNVYTGPAKSLAVAADSDNNDRSRGVQLRDQASPTLLNSIILPSPSAPSGSYALRAGTVGTEDYTATIQRLEHGDGAIKSNTFYRTGWSTSADFIEVGAAKAAGANNAARADASEARLVAVVDPFGTYKNVWNVDPFDEATYIGAFGVSNNTLNESLTSGHLDPRPVDAYSDASPTVAPVAQAPKGAGADQVGYRGAFSDDFGSELWTTGWTAANKLGRLVNGL